MSGDVLEQAVRVGIPLFVLVFVVLGIAARLMVRWVSTIDDPQERKW